MARQKINHQWPRVIRTPTPPEEKCRQEHNKNTLKSKKFQELCKKAGVAPTTRQASKFNNRKGLAFKKEFFGHGNKKIPRL